MNFLVISFARGFLRNCKLTVLAAVLLIGACAQPDGAGSDADSKSGARDESGLDMSKGPNKVTADDYAVQPIASGDEPLASVTADGTIAPFGMASRAKREIAVTEPAPAAQVAAASVPAIFTAQCAACHGADAAGVEGLGLDLTTSQLVADSSAAELVEFLKAGRMPTDPASVTGIPMPGFAWMPDADLDELAAHLKSL